MEERKVATKQIAIFLMMAGLGLVLLSVFFTWSTYCPECNIHQSGWELISQPLVGFRGAPGGGDINLIVDADGQWFFSGLIFIVLVPILLIVVIVAATTTERKVFSGALLFLLTMSGVLMVISIINLLTIIDIKPYAAGGGLFINTLGIAICLAGSILAAVLQFRKSSESIQAA